jgi:hypothetical protein
LEAKLQANVAVEAIKARDGCASSTLSAAFSAAGLAASQVRS